MFWKLLLPICFLGGCSEASSLENPNRITRSAVDQYGVVCYTTAYRGEFQCVKVK